MRETPVIEHLGSAAMMAPPGRVIPVRYTPVRWLSAPIGDHPGRTLDQFYAEITDWREACLPRNLPDEWLALVSGALDQLLGVSADADRPREDGSLSATGPGVKAIGLAAVLTILRAKGSMPVLAPGPLSWA